MHVYLKLKDGVENWVIAEIPGELQFREGHGLNSKFIGDLLMEKVGNGECPVLIIGHNVLRGVFKNLDKPIAVMTKTMNSTDDSSEYIISAIIKKKLVFQTMSKLITFIGNPMES